MPGIVGLIGKLRKEDALCRLEQMLDTLKYESFYLQGMYSNENLGVYVAWSAHPESFGDGTHAQSQDRKLDIFLTGEVFNATLASDHGVTPLTDLYRALGNRFYGALNGTFSGLVVDSSAGKVTLFNDRLNYEKIHYSHDNAGVFHFASEAKALLRVLPHTRAFDRTGLGQFLRFGCTFDERTLYNGVSRLPPASVWEFSAGESTPRKSMYFHPEDWETDPALSSEAAQKDFIDIFRRVLPSYIRSTDDSALSLTGGWDTRMILAAQRFEPGSLPCYTFAGFSGDTTDVCQARKVAQAVDQQYSVLRLQQDFLENFAEHVEKTVYVSDGYGGVCLSHEIYLNRIARNVSHVRLTGNFGSEVLRGVSTFKGASLHKEWYGGELSRELHESEKEWRGVVDERNSARFAVFREIPWKLATSLRLANSQLRVRTPYLDNEILRLACMRPANISGHFAPDAAVKCMRPALLKIPTDRGQSGENSGLAEALRRFWFEGTFKLDYWATEGAPDFLTFPIDRWRLNRFLPVRHKYLDYRQWLRGPLREYSHDLLTGSNAVASDLVGRGVVKRLLRDHASGTRNTLSDISALMNLELTQKCLFRDNQESGSRRLTSLSSVNNLVEGGVPRGGN